MSKNKNVNDENVPSNSKRTSTSDSEDEVDANSSSKLTKKTKTNSHQPCNNNVEGEDEGDVNRRRLPRPHTCLQALRRWQSKQLAQSIVDNAINKVLGDLGNSSPVNVVSLGFLNPQIIENEGVAVAISQQGLHRRRCMAALAASESEWNDQGPSSTTDSKRLDDNRSRINSQNICVANNDQLVRPEDLLNQAVSCAISTKGLASVSHD